MIHLLKLFNNPLTKMVVNKATDHFKHKAEKQKVLKGRGVVLRYANGHSAGKYFYRELIKGTKRYRYTCPLNL